MRTIAIRIATALPIIMSFAFADVAAARQAKNLSYEQAWAKCKAEVDRTVPGDQQTTRATVGGGCMRSYGYRLKRKM
jgi:hypothetical protein